MVQKNNSGFTLVEMMVVISIIGILMAIALPAISAARESARNSACANNLRQFGVGLVAVAGRFGTLGTGAMDWPRDGAVTEFGWVADLVNQGSIPGEMLCRSNTNQVSATYKDLLQGNFNVDPCWPNLLGSEPHTQPDGTVIANPCRIIVGTWTGTWQSPWTTTYNGGTPPMGEDRRKLVEEMILKKGFNTNYTASWFLVRSEPRLDKDGNLDPQGSCTLQGMKERLCTLGPLSLARLDSSGVPISHVPLLADGANAGLLPEYLGSFAEGTPMSAMYSAGPIDKATKLPPSFTVGTPYGGPTGWWAGWAKKTLQDYRAFGPVHGGTCNILFADGSVRPFRDSNSDGVLDNGFVSPPPPDGEFELPISNVYSGWAIRN